MSLVILSNDASENTITGVNSSIYKPFSFRNSLTSTMTLPPNCEVALQSCKICLDGSLAITGGKRVFYLYLGEIIDRGTDVALVPNARTTINQTLSAPIRIPLFPTRDDEVIALTHQELADEIERALLGSINTKAPTGTGGGIFHPNYLGLNNITIERGATGEIEGFQFQIVYHAQATDVLVSPANATAMLNLAVDGVDSNRRVDGEYGGGRVNQAKKYALATDVNDNVVMNTINIPAPAPSTYLTANQNAVGTTFASAPISLFNGECNFDITDVSKQRAPALDKHTRFCVGLTRFSTTRQIAPNRREVIKLGPRNFVHQAGKQFYIDGSATNDMRWMQTYMDFGVLVSEDGILRVIHAVEGDDAVPLTGNDVLDGGLKADSPKIQQIDYTRGGTTAAPFNVVYDMDTNAREYSNIRFTIKGAVMKVEMQTAAQFAGGTGDVLLELATGAPVISQNFKPICQNCWNLYPTMLINNHLQSQVGTPFNPDSVPADGYNIKLAKYTTCTLAHLTTHTPQFQPSWYQTLMERNTAQGFSIYKDLEKRWKNIDITIHPYPNIDVANEKFTQFAPVLVVSESGAYAPSPGANCRELFGFDNQSAAISDSPPWTASVYVAGPPARTITSLISTSIPTSKSTKSIFVRLDNFNQETTNAGNGNPSRIIAHLPRFDGQAETGRLFFEPSTLVYLDLKNPAPLNVNQLDVSMVYADERLVTGLTGTTIIVLHFREKQK